MTTLKDINFGLNQYCGPAVLSALTGESTDRCAAVISAVSSRKEIKAVNKHDIIESLRRLRFNVIEQSGGSTLFGVLNRIYENDGQYIIFVPQHVVAVEIKDKEIYICDNHTKTPINIKQSARLTQKVNSVLKVEARNPPRFIGAMIRIDRMYNGVDIISVNRYENPEDDTQYRLGNIKFVDNKELEQILLALRKEYDL
jgi:hypothetical protein